ncbi:MAG: regulator of protease activity HflC (stomatin/prohibitin superfamily), partial [Saprospiraceae bacterium]
MNEIPILLIPLLFIGAFIIFSGLFTVKQQTTAIVERLGKFHSIRQ